MVITKSGTAERAREKNADRATNVMAGLRELLGHDGEITTANYSLTKTYTGEFVANHMIEVHVKDPKIAGKVIDAATKSGAAVIGGIESSALDEQGARSDALKQATVRAQANAEAIAEAMGMRLLRFVSAETSTPPAPPPLLSGPQVSEKRSAATPIDDRTIEVHAQVVVTIEVTR